MRCFLCFVLAVSAALLCLAAVSFAEEREVIPVTVNGTVVMRLFDTPEDNERDLASAAEAVIKAKIAEGASVKSIKTEKSEDGASILWGDRLVIVVTPEQAKAQNSECMALAEVWARNIMKAAEVRPLKLSSNSLKIAIGESDFVTAGESGEIFCSYDPKALDISVEDDVIIFTPLKTGDFSVTVNRGKSKGSVRISARERAGIIAPEISLEVTGSPASEEIIKNGILYRISDAVTLKPGASMYLKQDLEIFKGLGSGSSAVFPVQVIAEGKGYMPAEGTVSVSVVNSSIKWDGPGALWISNRPETLDRDGILFKKSLETGAQARFMYSHKNGSSFHRRVAISFRNPGRKPARLLFRNAFAGPDKFEMYAGHKAAARYMKLFSSESGYVLDIPAFSSVLISDTNITPGFLFSGICDLKLLEGDSVEVSAESFPAGGKKGRLEMIDEPFDPFKIHPHGVFPAGIISLESSYRLSSEDSSVEIGKWPWLIDAETGEPNTGNFGVVYIIYADLINDTGYPSYVNIDFTPLNGTSQGTVIIDGEMIETPVTRKDCSTTVKKMRLNAKENRRVIIMTIPEASSCYPVKFTFSKGV